MPELPDAVATRLSSFGDDHGPAGLPGAAAARRRGAQRTRRARAALAGGGITALALATVLGGALDAGGGRDRVSIPATTSAPDPAPEPPVLVLEQALLDADDVSAALGGRWTVRPVDDAGAAGSPLPRSCTEGVVASGPDAAQRSFGLGGRAEQVLVRYPDDAAAAAALGGLVDALEQCPAALPTTRLVGGLPATSDTRVYGQRTTPEGSVHFAVERLGPFLSAVSAPSLEQLPALVDAAAVEQRAALLDDPTPGQEVPLDVRRALLTQDDAARVLPGPWRSTELPDGGSEVPAFPCGAGPAPSLPGDGRVSAGVRLSVQREAGGPVVRQQVEQYVGPTTAARAYDLVRERVASCPEQSLPDAQGPGSVVTQVVDAGPELDDGVRTLLVRVVSTCRDCAPAVEWYAVQQAGDVLSTLGAAEAEDGDRGAAVVEPFAELVGDRLRQLG